MKAGEGRAYPYVGSADLGDPGQEPPQRIRITGSQDVLRWACAALSRTRHSRIIATFIVDLDGALWVADRQSEHVQCARGAPVLSAGEISLEILGQAVEVVEVTNQSTGYCPEPESWPSVASALRHARLAAPDTFTTEFTFRRCEACSSNNVVKEGWWECAICQSPLPADWNFGAG